MRNTGSGMGHREHGVWDAGRGSKYMTQEQGPQGIGFDVRQRRTEGPFFMSVPGAPARGSRSQFSPLTKACLVCLLLSASLDAKEWECPRGLELRVSPHQLRQGSRLGAKFMAQEEPARPPSPLCQKQL